MSARDLNLNTAEIPRADEPAAIFTRAGERAKTLGLAYAGAVTPAEAHRLRESGAATIVDVRTPEEHRTVGHVPEAPLIVWPRGGGDQELQGFVQEIVAAYAPEETLLMLCRSGVRSHYAAHILAQAGYTRAYNILEGFEGAAPGQGWRAAGLPWNREG